MNLANFRLPLGLRQILVFFLILFFCGWCNMTHSLAAKVNNSILLTTEEKLWLEAHPTIRLAPDPSFQPIEYFDINGDYKGIGADYVKLIEKKLDSNFKLFAAQVGMMLLLAPKAMKWMFLMRWSRLPRGKNLCSSLHPI